MSYQQEKFREIADAVREKTGTEETIKPSQFKDKISEVFDAGTEAEKRERWSRQLDALNNGTWVYGFSGNGWNDDTFTPYTDLTTQEGTNVSSMFYRSNISDMKGIFEKYGTSLDLSGASNITYLFSTSSVVKLPRLVFDNVANITQLFSACESLESVDELVITKAVTNAANAFSKCTSLEEIRISAKINADLDLHWSPLSKESVESVVSALSDTATEKTVTFSKTQMELLNSGTWWDDLKATKPNWYFELL